MIDRLKPKDVLTVGHMGSKWQRTRPVLKYH